MGLFNPNTVFLHLIRIDIVLLMLGNPGKRSTKKMSYFLTSIPSGKGEEHEGSPEGH